MWLEKYLKKMICCENQLRKLTHSVKIINQRRYINKKIAHMVVLESCMEKIVVTLSRLTVLSSMSQESWSWSNQIHEEMKIVELKKILLYKFFPKDCTQFYPVELEGPFS